MQNAINTGDDIHIMLLQVIGMGNFVNRGLLRQVSIEASSATMNALLDACTRLNDAGRVARVPGPCDLHDRELARFFLDYLVTEGQIT